MTAPAVAGASTANGAAIVSRPFLVHQPNSHWHLGGTGPSPAPGPSGTFALCNRQTDQCLDVSGALVTGAALVQQPCNGSQRQQWYYGPQSDCGDATQRFVDSRGTGLPSSSGVRVMKADNGGPAGTRLVLAPKDVFNSSRSITAPVPVTSTAQSFG